MQKLRFCVDIDNVVAKSDEVMRRIIRTITCNRVDLRYEDITKFNYWECGDRYGNRLSKEQWTDVHERFSADDQISSIEPFNDARSCIGRLRERFEVLLVTSRLPITEDSTRRWLQVNQIPYDELIYSTHRRKHELPNISMVIEDDYDQAIEFAKNGTRTYLVTHPWNQGRTSAPNLSWVMDWPELLKQAEGKGGNF